MLTKRLLAASLALTMLLPLAACGKDETKKEETKKEEVKKEETQTTPHTDKVTMPTVIEDEENPIEKLPEGENEIIWMSHYDLNPSANVDRDVALTLFEDVYGGKIKYSQTSWNTRFDDLANAIMSNKDVPDIFPYEWIAVPCGVSKNMYQPIDPIVDFDDPLWVDVKEDAELYAIGGKHYVAPFYFDISLWLFYQKDKLADAGIADPYELYLEGNWTWDTFRELCVEWCNIDDEKIGYAGTHAMSFVATTGTPLIDVRKDGTIVNNINDPNLARAMQFASTLYRDGLVYQNEFVDWLSPQLWAKNSDRVLFYGMNPDWVYSEAAAAVQNLKGVENDICGVVSDFAFVPFPRDPSSETYTIAYDTFGYMVPKGAKNIEGAIDWIHLNRIYEIDEEVRATARDRAINPEPVYYIEGKYEVAACMGSRTV